MLDNFGNISVIKLKLHKLSIEMSLTHDITVIMQISAYASRYIERKIRKYSNFLLNQAILKLQFFDKPPKIAIKRITVNRHKSIKREI